MNSHDRDELKDELKKARNAALKYLSFRPRTVYEVESFLKRKNFSDMVIEKVIEELANLDYLNDQKFTEHWITSSFRNKPLGRWRIKQELCQKGIKEETVERWLDVFLNDSENREAELALIAARKQLKHYQGLPVDKMKARLSSFLKRRGFSYGSICYALEQILGKERN